MILRIVSIVFPIFAVVLTGYLYGRWHRPEMVAANRLNMDVFMPALIFTALAGKSVALGDNFAIIAGSIVIVFGSGLVAWPFVRLLRLEPRTLLPSIMFNNAGNMGVPLMLLTFGDEALGAAVILLVVVTFLQFGLSPWIVGGASPLSALWREPLLLAAVLGVAVSLSGVTLWPPLMTACKLVADISIGLMIFSLGVRLSSTRLTAWRAGLAGAVLTPLSGLAIAWLFCHLVEVPRAVADILYVFSALPPAVSNFIFAERYGREPDKVAAIVAMGNAAAIVFIPLTLAFRL